MVVSFTKASGLRLLSTCTRPRFPLSVCSFHNPSLVLSLNSNSNTHKINKLSNTAALSLSNYSNNASIPSSTRVFCTTLNVSEDSASAPPPLISSVEDESVKIKNVANTLEIKVGKIIKAWRHEEADSLYVEEVDVGETEPRIICSGLVKYVPLEDLQDKKVVVLANLKARNMRGVKSHGMLMAASDKPHENVELLLPPEGSAPGDRVWFGPEDDLTELPEAATPNQIHKKKIWESVQPQLKTDESGVAALGGVHVMRTSAGVVVSPSLKNANIS